MNPIEPSRRDRKTELTQYAALITGLVVYYFSVVYYHGFFRDPQAFLVGWASDSDSYIQVADWMFRGLKNSAIENRTFLYPLVVGLIRPLFGMSGVWVIQMVFWLAGSFLFFLNLESLVASRLWQRLFFVGFCLVWTPLLLSMAVLTESMAFFLFSLAGFFLVRANRNRFSVPLFLVVAGTLPLVKPNYMPMFYGVLVVAIILKLRNRFPLSWKNLALSIGVSLIPLFTQTILHRLGTGLWGTSNVGGMVLKLNLYAQVLARVEGRDMYTVYSELKTQVVSTGSILTFLFLHLGITLEFIRNNFIENICSVLHIGPAPIPHYEHTWRKILNELIYWTHLGFLVPTLYGVWRASRLVRDQDIEFLLLAALFIFSMLPVGFSIWAADRYTAPLLPVWPLLYIQVWKVFVKESRVSSLFFSAQSEVGSK